jgi:hypothetical protein
MCLAAQGLKTFTRWSEIVRPRVAIYYWAQAPGAPVDQKSIDASINWTFTDQGTKEILHAFRDKEMVYPKIFVDPGSPPKLASRCYSHDYGPIRDKLTSL